MYTIKDNIVIQVHAKSLIKLGSIEDVRIDKVEQLVAAHFEVNVWDLNSWHRDTPAKLMCGFLLHEALGYSVGSIANRYNIFTEFLQKNITEHYHKCLLDEAFFKLVMGFKDAFIVKESKPQLTMHN